MSNTAGTDDHGRILIPHEIRERHGTRYRIVERNDRVELIPLQDNPIAGLRDAVGDAFEGKSMREIKQEPYDTDRRNE